MVLASGESIGADRIRRESPSRVEDVRGARIGTSLGGFGESAVLRFAKATAWLLGDTELRCMDASEVPAHLPAARSTTATHGNPMSRRREEGLSRCFPCIPWPGGQRAGLSWLKGKKEDVADPALIAVIEAADGGTATNWMSSRFAAGGNSWPQRTAPAGRRSAG